MEVVDSKLILVALKFNYLQPFDHFAGAFAGNDKHSTRLASIHSEQVRDGCGRFER